MTIRSTGISLGIPLNLMTSYFTYKHYHHFEMTPSIIALEFLLGIYTYGGDKLRDAVQYEIAPFDTKKKPIYDKLLANRNEYTTLFKTTLIAIQTLIIQSGSHDLFNTGLCYVLYEFSKSSFSSFKNDNSHSPLLWSFSSPLGIEKILPIVETKIIKLIPFILSCRVLEIVFRELHTINTLPFLLLLDTTPHYIYIKQHFGFIKPFYVSALWSLSVSVLPQFMIDGSSLSTDAILPFLLIFSLTNIQDIKDIKEDRQHGIETIPTRFGSLNTIFISGISMLLFLYYNTIY